MDSTQELVRMANQIASYFAAYPKDEAVKETADHIRAFWEPRMRTALLAYVAGGGQGLDEIARLASEKLPKPAPVAPAA